VERSDTGSVERSDTGSVDVSDALRLSPRLALDHTSRASRPRRCWPSARCCSITNLHSLGTLDRLGLVHAIRVVAWMGLSRLLHTHRTGRSPSIAGPLCRRGYGTTHLHRLDTIRHKLVVLSSISSQKGKAVMTLLPLTTKRIFLAAGFFFLPPVSPPMNPIGFSKVTS